MDGWRRFLKRKPLCSGESTTQVRMQTINHVNVEQYYDLHKEVLGEFDLGNHPEKIYNMDESAISLDPHPSKLAARKGEICVLWKDESDNNCSLW